MSREAVLNLSLRTNARLLITLLELLLVMEHEPADEQTDEAIVATSAAIREIAVELQKYTG